jgi:hypothetical protein
MNKLQLISLFNQDQRKDVEYPGMRREVTPDVVRHVDTSKPGEGMVIYSQLDERNVEAVIQEQVRYFENLGQDFGWKVYDYDQPADLKERLKAHGSIMEEAEALMVADLAKALESLWQPVVHDVRRIKDQDELAIVLSIEGQVWKEDFTALGAYLKEALTHSPDQMSVYVAYVNKIPAGTAWIYFPKHSPFASLWGGVCLSEYRKQGLYTSLGAKRAQEARARQARYITVGASPMSRPILEKFGFEFIAWIYPCRWTRKPPESKEGTA